MTRPRLAIQSCLLLIALLAFAPGLQAQNATPVDLSLQPREPFRFVVYADTRFTDPTDTHAANAPVRQTLVKAIAEAGPSFISVDGDLTYNGDDPDDWKVWDAETAPWRDRGIPIYPALGNHEVHGNVKLGLDNYFQRFPDLHRSRYYSVRVANTLVLVLDSSVDESSGPQGQWLTQKLNAIPSSVDFVFVLLHHPPYTSSSDAKMFGGGHSARSPEQALAKMLETRQASMRARIVVFSGHVHNYERHEHGGVLYFVCGGGGAHAYPIERAASDPFQSKEVNYHYLLAEVQHRKLKVTMVRLHMIDGKPSWSQPDSVALTAPAEKTTSTHAANFTKLRRSDAILPAIQPFWRAHLDLHPGD